MSALQVRVFELSRLIAKKDLQRFLEHCDLEERGLGWNGLVRAEYWIRDLSHRSGSCELRAHWVFAPWAQNPEDHVGKVQTSWQTKFGLKEIAEPKQEHLTASEWSMVHVYHGKDRQDSRSTLMDEVLEKTFIRVSPKIASIKQKCKDESLPPISLSEQDGFILKNLVSMIGAKRGIEIGTLGGYSAAWLCEGMGVDGILITIERDAKRSRFAADNLTSAGFKGQVECRSGEALQVLSNIETEFAGQPLWDFVFIDANKDAYGDYVEWAMKNVRKGGLILADNAYLWGAMIHYPHPWKEHPENKEDRVSKTRLHGFDASDYKGMSKAWDLLSKSADFETWMLPVPDGILVARKL